MPKDVGNNGPKQTGQHAPGEVSDGRRRQAGGPVDPRFRSHSGWSGSGPTADGSSADRAAGAGPPGAGTSAPDGGLPPIREYVTEEEWHARRQPQPVDEILGRIMTDVGGGGGATAAMLEARWSEVVGPDFAARSRPGSCRSGNLTVLVADGATASKMRFATAKILHNAAQVLGERAISTVGFRVNPGLSR